MKTWNDKKNTETSQQRNCLLNGNAVNCRKKKQRYKEMKLFNLMVNLMTYFTCDIPTRIFFCVSSTPLGIPVVPDEHNTNATLFCISTGLQFNSLQSST